MMGILGLFENMDGSYFRYIQMEVRCYYEKGTDVRSNSNLASRLKSRARNCPFVLIARKRGASGEYTAY